MNALIQELMMSSCQYFTNDFKGNIDRVSYRQCGRTIQKRGQTEAICLHENKRPTEAIRLQK